MTDHIVVTGIEFYGHCGVSPEEREVGTRYVVDVDLVYDLRQAAASDDVRHTINYSTVTKIVVEIGERRRYKLLEALADEMARTILRRFPAEAVTIRLRKRPPPITRIVDSAGIEITRTPADYGDMPYNRARTS
jgi:dihydroneopterin aldolase